jgi:hypothetical protein
MVGFDQVYFRKTVQPPMRSFSDYMLGRGVTVWLWDSIEAVVVAAEVPRAVLFGYQVKGGHPGRVGAANNTCFLWARTSLQQQGASPGPAAEGRLQR